MAGSKNNKSGTMIQISVLVITSCLHVATSTPYCGIGQSIPGTPPPYPQLPDQFQTVIEGNMADRSLTITGFEYFDRRANMAATNILYNGVRYITIFDYPNNQVLNVKGTSNCTVSNLEGDPSTIFFGNVTTNGVPHVFSTAGALYFQQSAGQAYRGPTVVRGIRVDQWRSCHYWAALKANFTLDYFFSAVNWTDPIGRPQIPVRAEVTGVVSVLGGVRHFHHYYDYYDFRSAIADPVVFQTPLGVVCPGRKNKLPVPKVPRRFHLREEIRRAPLGKTELLYYNIWFDADLKLGRYDLVLPIPLDGFKLGTPVSIIIDFNTGLKYIKDSVTGQCNVVSLDVPPHGTFDHKRYVQSGGQTSFLYSMSSPEQFFHLNSNLTFTGKRMARGLPCSVYSGIITVDNRTFDAEIFFLEDGVQVFDDGGGTGTHSRVIVQGIISDQITGESTLITTNIGEYGEHSDVSVFDVTSCYSDAQMLQFTVRFQGQYQTGLTNQLIPQVYTKLTSIMRVSPLRLQDVILNYDRSFLYVSAKLLDRTPYLAQFSSVLNKTTLNLAGDMYLTSQQVTSEAQCAEACVIITNFTCNSFDYCATDTKRTCRLNRNHTSSGSRVSTPTICDHYTRSVDGAATPELSVDKAFANLQLAVSQSSFSLNASLFGVPLTYGAVDVALFYGSVYPEGQLNFSDTISYHLETKVTLIQDVFNFHIWYDYEYQLVRYDALTNGPTINIHDYNTGLSYVINKDSGQCVVGPITNSSFDVQPPSRAQQNQTGYVLKLKSPLRLFDLNQRATFIGQSTIRGILCDAYEYTDNFNFGKTQKKAVFQFYFINTRWREFSSTSGVTVQGQPVRLVVTSMDSTMTEQYDFSDFTQQHPDLRDFNIQPCFLGQQTQNFLIKFNQTYHPVLDTYLSAFIKAVQRQLSSVTGITPLRFQNPEVTYDDPYTLYKATIVQQSPAVLDFTKMSGRQSLHSSDASFVGITSEDQCAGVCRNFTGFNCLSFDFCPQKGMCMLNTKHISDGKELSPSGTCDHFSRTVDSGPLIEATIAQALTILQDRVARRTLTVNLQLKNKTVISYPAIHIDRNILRQDYGQSNSAILRHFTVRRDMSQTSTPVSRYYAIAVDDCASRCLSEGTFDCGSFTFCPDEGLCSLSDLDPDQNTSSLKTNNLCSVYTRVYTDRFTAYEGYSMPRATKPVVANIANREACARACVTSNNESCKSFDYCSSTKSCYLRTSHLLDADATPIAKVGGCTHFSRKYIYDFTKTSGKILFTDQSLTFNNTSLDNCSKLCVENNLYACKYFTFCGNISTCTIYSGITTTRSALNITNSAVCDLYTRNIPAPNQPFTSGVSKSTSNSGYGGGAMGGVAFAGLLLGALLGAGLLYLLRTKQLLTRRRQHGDRIGRQYKDTEDQCDEYSKHY